MGAVTDPLEHIRRLAREIGPRPSTGEGERRAAAYIQEQMERLGYAVKTEEFRSVRSFGHVYILVYLISFLGFVAALFENAVLGLLLTGIGLVAFVGENTTALRLATALVPKGKSQNVVGRMTARDLPRRRLILTAHYDSQKSGVMWHPKLVKTFRRSFLVLTFCMFILPVLDGLEAVTQQRVYFFISVPFAAYVLYALALLVHRELAFKHVDGANDNASGVAVMLSLAEALAQDVASDTEVMVVATGCEEAGLVGMQDFLHRHSDDVRRAWIINIDNVGAGEVSYTTAEGMLLRHRTSKELREVAEKAAAVPGVAVQGRPFRTMSTDAEPALLRGHEAITVISLQDGVPVNWHWHTDVIENIDPDSVDTAYRFIEAMVRRLIA